MKIKEIRKQLGLTQAQLAKLVEVKQASVSLWESGDSEPSRNNLRKLAKVLNCSFDELLDDTGGKGA